MTGTSFIKNRGSADQVPPTTPTRPIKLPGCGSGEASPSATVPREAIIRDTPAPRTSIDTRYDDTEKLNFLLDLPKSSLLPPAPANTFGRDTIIDDLLGFAERFASVTLSGAGGIGKTTIALTLLHHDQIAAKFDKHRHFICCDDIANSLDSFLGRLSNTIGAHKAVDIGQLRSHLAVSPPRILVLDGLDSIIDPLAPGSVEIATAIEEFGRFPNIFLVATNRMDVRIPDFRRIDVPTLSICAAKDTFYDLCCLERSIAVEELLTELDFHPLSIDLLAGVVRENGWDEPRLLKAWNDNKTSILKVSGRRSLEVNIRSTLLSPTIRELGITAQETLEAIALYPGGVKEAKLESTFPKVAAIGEAANALCKFSLMYRQDGVIKMLSPFRFYFLESARLRPGHGRGGTHFGMKTMGKFRSAGKSEHEKVWLLVFGPNNRSIELVALLRFSAKPNHPDRAQVEPPSVGSASPQQSSSPAVAPYNI